MKNCRALWIGINKIVYSKNKNKTNSPSSLIQDGKIVLSTTFLLARDNTLTIYKNFTQENKNNN